MVVSLLNQKGLPRGLRNNNPGNLRISNIKWLGKIPNNQNTDKSFEQFTTMHYGLRAMATDIINDVSKKNLNTLASLINAYAPPTENDTTNYINVVSKSTGIAPNQQIKLTNDLLAELMLAKIFVENGKNVVLKHLPNIKQLILTAILDVNPATKKRISITPLSVGAGALLLIGLFFF